MSNFVLL